MCQLYALTDPGAYRTQARSIRLSGHVTSVRLEQRFWQIVERIAAESSMSPARFISALHDEVLKERGEVGNLASLLRVVCVNYVQRQLESRAGLETLPAIPDGPAMPVR